MTYSSSTGLYYENQRWYDNSTGRFISQDPLPGHLRIPQSLNSYTYVLNQPTLLTDPSGMAWCWPLGNDCGGGGAGPVNTANFWENVEKLPQIDVQTSPASESLINTATCW